MPASDKMLDGAVLPVGRDGKAVDLFDWEDYEGSRNAIYDAVKATMERQLSRREHNGVAMSVTDIDYADPPYRGIAEQKKALHTDGYLHRRLRGTVTLTDIASGKVLDKKENITLMKVPMLTNRGTFVRDGNEWNTINQTRLIPGAYSRWQANGDLETQFNVRAGTGGSMRVSFDPEKAIYKLKAAGQEMHLYSLLHDIGVSDDEMRRSWGDEVFNTNREGYDHRTLEKAYSRFVPEWDRKKNPARTSGEKAIMVKNALNRAQVARFAVQSTLPNWFDREKSAAWRNTGETMEKVASLSADDIRNIATYINAAADKNINVDGTREEIEAQIRNVITTGDENGNARTKDNAAMLVKQMSQARAMAVLRKKFGDL